MHSEGVQIVGKRDMRKEVSLKKTVHQRKGELV